MLGLFPLYFPNGRLVSPRWRPVVWYAVLATGITGGLAAIQSGDGETPGIPNPLGVADFQQLNELFASLVPALWLGVGIASTASLVVRFRRSRGEERQQIKWSSTPWC